MKKSIIPLLFVFLLITKSAQAFTAADPIDKLATPQTKELYNRLKETSGRKILFGQYYSVPLKPWDDPYGKESQCYKVTQNVPSIFYVDYQPDPWRSIRAYTAQIKEHYEKDGIILISWHMQNWVTRKNAWDLAGNTVARILQKGFTRSKYLAALDDLAEYLLKLKDKDGKLIPVIFRPFHENDIGCFWWGTSTTTSAQYVQLWRDLISYLKDKKGVHNVLYCYSPEMRNGYAYDGELYPGDDYVDVFGLDYYNKTITKKDINGESGLSRLQTLYDLSVKKNKPFGLTEGLRNEFPNKVVANPDDAGIYPNYWTEQFFEPILADSKAKYASFVIIYCSAVGDGNTGWGPKQGNADEKSFRDMSLNPQIGFIEQKVDKK
jgi:hypothetical protein